VRAASALAALAGTLLAAGCGGNGASAPLRHLHLTAQERHGKTLFVERCGSCHTLADAGTSGIVGPPLAQPWAASRVLEVIVDGPGEMPGGIARGASADAIAAYVAAATRAASGR
jgi:mono/diheme cytochrome c family protein